MKKISIAADVLILFGAVCANAYLQHKLGCPVGVSMLCSIGGATTAKLILTGVMCSITSKKQSEQEEE